MARETLRVALIRGAMYDRLYRSLARFERESRVRVRIAFGAPHPELNAHYQTLDSAPYDLLSTHTKYAPSQLRLLAPLDEHSSALALDGFSSPLLELARVDGRLYGLPRSIDFKLLHYRTDLVESAPETWDELRRIASGLTRGGFDGFVFPGRDSGLFGAFYELAEMAGAKLFPPCGAPEIGHPGVRWALETLRDLYRTAAPQAIVAWHYDEVHRCFLEGHAAMVCDWPAYYASYRRGRASKVKRRFWLARMPAGGSGRRKAYAGCHTFALTPAGARKPAAIELLRFLTAPEQQAVEAAQGAIPSRTVSRARAASDAGPAEAQRSSLIETVLAADLLVPPALAYYPEIEEILWRNVQAAMTGETAIGAALGLIERRIAAVVRRHRGARPAGAA